MEKLMRLLSPKTVNYEAIRVDNASGGMTAQDVLLAISYAKLTPVQNKLLQCYALNQNQLEQLKAAALFIHAGYVSSKEAEPKPDHEIAMYIALVEVCAVSADYKPSERNRAVIGGVSRMQVQRKLGALVTVFKDLLLDEIEIIEDRIEYQMNK